MEPNLPHAAPSFVFTHCASNLRQVRRHVQVFHPPRPRGGSNPQPSVFEGSGQSRSGRSVNVAPLRNSKLLCEMQMRDRVLSVVSHVEIYAYDGGAQSD